MKLSNKYNLLSLPVLFLIGYFCFYEYSTPYSPISTSLVYYALLVGLLMSLSLNISKIVINIIISKNVGKGTPSL